MSIPWLKETPTPEGVRLHVGWIGGYLPPLRARFSVLSLAAFSVFVGLKVALYVTRHGHAISAYVAKTGLPGWIWVLIWSTPLILPALIWKTFLGQVIGEILFGSRFTIVVTREYMQVIRWFVYRPRYPLGPGISFERIRHPGAQTEVAGNALRKAQHPKHPIFGMQFDQYQRAMTVVYRNGAKVVRLMNVYDRTPSDLGHKADELVRTLQRLHSEAQVSNKSTDPTKTAMQYGVRPGVA